jgi:2Fe-2S ferredoxin
MIKVTYIEFNGTERTVEVEEGVSLMEAAVTHLVPGIDGDCGGMCACAT